jgi:hypothetical protein
LSQIATANEEEAALLMKIEQRACSRRFTMFKFLSRMWNKPVSRRRFTVRLDLEALETRTVPAALSPGAVSTAVHPGPSGNLVYVPDAFGDTVPDFSNAGYEGGNAALPDTPGGVQVPVKITLAPGTPQAQIQQAIDLVGQMPLVNGFRGAVLLQAGDYYLSGQLTIHDSGVVLRGQGQGAGGTVLHVVNPFMATDAATLSQVARYDQNHPALDGAIRILGDPSGAHLTGDGSLPIAPGSPITPIVDLANPADTYVPVGARSFHVASTAGFQVGDTIIVDRPSPANWIADLGMTGQDGWRAGTMDLDFDRVITAIDPVHNVITIDAPLTQALDQRYAGPARIDPTSQTAMGWIYRYSFPGRISNVGIENLSAVSEYNPNQANPNIVVPQGQRFPLDEPAGAPVPLIDQHAWTFISVVAAQNAWVTNVTARQFVFSAVDVQKSSKWVTVDGSSNLDPISTTTGGHRDSFHIGGQLVLVENCYARNGRHDFITDSIVPGPNVFLNCRADDALSESGPHDRFATGTLFDDVVVHAAATGGDSQAGGLNAYNRGLEGGSLQGWAGSNMVFWNCTAAQMLVEQLPGATPGTPPLVMNYAIGDVTNIETTVPARLPQEPLVSFDSPGQRVGPASLYLAQLHERLGAAASLVNVTSLVRTSAKVVAGNLVITITNVSQAIIQGPWQLVLSPVAVGLTSGLGTRSSPPVNVNDQDLAPGQSFKVVIALHKPLPPGEQIHVGVLAWKVLVAPAPPEGY